MDYTLIHYQVDEWEATAYEHVREYLLGLGWPVRDLAYDPDLVTRGLTLDTELGNVLKTNRFGYVKAANHGTRPLQFQVQKRIYSRTLVDLSNPAYRFLNTFFAKSEACMFLQLIDLFDSGVLPEVKTYTELYHTVRRGIDAAHMEGQLKADILRDPERFVEVDEEVALALQDQRDAGKKVMLITNSEWPYAAPIMSFAFDRFMPAGKTWQDLFDLSIVSARKPSFFQATAAAFEVVDQEKGLLSPVIGPLLHNGIYVGGCAAMIEEYLGCTGDEILYVGDHVFADVHVSKDVLRWRTALVVRELEKEIEAINAFAPRQALLSEKMERKIVLEHQLSVARRDARRAGESHNESIKAIRDTIVELDREIGPLAQESGQLNHARWGLIMQTGNDKSQMARQIERYADVYTSRVANFLHATPYAYLRPPYGRLPHHRRADID